MSASASILAIRDAIQEGSEYKLRLLLNLWPRVGQMEKEFDEPLLCRAIKYKKHHLVPLLFEKGAGINAADPWGTTPLMLSALTNTQSHTDTLEFLLKNGADANAKDMNDKTALMCAAKCNHLGAAKLLIEYGADVHARSKRKGSCVQLAASDDSSDSPDILKLLFKHEADPNVVNNEGQTPLYDAVRNNKKNCVEVLLEHGANPNARDDSNRGPLHLAVACTEPNLLIVKKLIESDAVINACDRYGFTPLYLMLSNFSSKKVEIATYLVKHGAIVQDPKIYQSTFFQARDNSVKDICRMLQVFMIAGLKPKLVVQELKRLLGQSNLSEAIRKRKERDQRRIDTLVNHCSNAMSLQGLCRIVLREEIILHTPGTSLYTFIHELPLPPALKEFLLMDDYEKMA